MPILKKTVICGMIMCVMSVVAYASSSKSSKRVENMTFEHYKYELEIGQLMIIHPTKTMVIEGGKYTKFEGSDLEPYHGDISLLLNLEYEAIQGEDSDYRNREPAILEYGVFKKGDIVLYEYGIGMYSERLWVNGRIVKRSVEFNNAIEFINELLKKSKKS